MCKRNQHTANTLAWWDPFLGLLTPVTLALLLLKLSLFALLLLDQSLSKGLLEKKNKEVSVYEISKALGTGYSIWWEVSE